MSKKLDIGKIDAALKQAARAAVSGSRDERAGKLIIREADSGRFVPKKGADKSR